MIRRVGFASALATIAGLALIVAASPAEAAVQVGETFTPDSLDNENPCGGGYTFVLSTSPNGQYAVPFAGVITSWSFAANSSPPQLKLKLGRSAGGDSFSIVGESAIKTPSPNQLNTYPERIAVQPGDLLGFYTGSTGDCARHVPGGYGYHYKSGDQLPGPPTLFTDAMYSQAQSDISARVEPDADHDNFGDETQDQCLGTAGPQNGCPAPVVAPTPTGLRARALKKCKKTAKKKHWTKQKLRKCKKKAKLLPV